MPDTGLTSHVIEAICAWFDANGRDLPWRRPGTSAWGVLVSEVMSQQTPMSRVIGPVSYTHLTLPTNREV